MGKLLKWFALASLVGFPVALVGTRVGLWEYGPALTTVGISFLLALVVLVSALIVLFWKGRSDRALRQSALVAILLSAIPVLGIGTQILNARDVPAIHNISTDTVDPPEFDKIALIRDAKHNPLEYNTEELAELQTSAYPNVRTHYTSMSPEEAHRRALVVADVLGWEVINQSMIGGIIEATDTTGLWKFKDDIVIRLRSNADGVAVDLRSVSRVGRSDLGANARRIEAFIDAFEK